MAAAALALASAGCSTTPPGAPTAAELAIAEDAPFELNGRLSARRASEGIAVNVRWQHRPDRDELLLATPMGSAVARLAGDATRARLEFADGQVREASDFEALTEAVLGAPIPVRGLAWWVRGVPKPGSAHSVEVDRDRRVEVLRQDGWEVVYGYVQDARLPSRLTLRYPEVEVRIVIDRWEALAAP